MGYFLYNANSKKVDILSYEKELNAQIAKLEDEIKNKNEEIETKPTQNTVNTNIQETTDNTSSTTNNITYSYLKGTYKGTVSNEREQGEVYLILCENGIYFYQDILGTAAGSEGYYIFDGNDLTLHQILRCANDPGRTIASDTITLKINDDNSISDSKLNTVLKKSSNTVQTEYDICNELKTSLDSNLLN